MIDVRRDEKTTTVVRHVVETPVNWAEMQKLIRVVINDMGYANRRDEPADDLIWYEADDDGIAICYELTSTTVGQVAR